MENFDNFLFGERVRNLRVSHGLSQSALANTLGITPTQISDIEKGKTSTALKRAVLLATFFSVSLDYLVGLSDSPLGACALSERISALSDNAKERVSGYLDAMGY